MRTLADLQISIHYLVEQDIDVPTVGEDDYTLRTVLINKWIRDWSNEEGMLWNELWVMGTKTSTGATFYSLVSSHPTMKTWGGYIYYKEGTSAPIFYSVLKTQDIALLPNNSEAWVYFTGNPENGYTLYFNPNNYPTGTGTIYFPYYKKPTELSISTDKPEMFDPDYIVHGVASDILSQENPSESDKQFGLSQNKLKSMKTTNMMNGWYQNNQLPNRSNKLGVRGFGL